MSFVLTYGGIAKFGINSIVVDENGTVIYASNPIINPGANAGAATGGSGSLPISTNFGYNPTYVHKSKNVRTATQLYYYGLLDSREYDTAQAQVLNPKPFNQNYISKKSSIDEDYYEEVLELVASRSVQYEGGSAGTAIKAARLSALYQPAFTGIYNNRSSLEKEISTGNNSILIEVTASRDFYHIPTAADLHTLTVELNQSASAVAAQLGIQVNVIMPSISWHGITREPLHPNGPGNYYPYKTISNNNSSIGVIYDAVVEPRQLQQLKPIVASTIFDVGAYWFGNPPTVNGPADRIGIRYQDPDPLNNIFNTPQARRDPSYINIPPFISRTELGLSSYDLDTLLKIGNGGLSYLPTVKPVGSVTATRVDGTTLTYDWISFASTQGINSTNAVELLAPRVRLTAKLNLSAATQTVFTKGTYSHIEVPRVVTTGDEFTPSIIICHDSRKIYHFLYSYQDNESCVAYNVLRECEEDDKRTYMPLPPTSPYVTQPGGGPPPPTPPPPPPPPTPLQPSPTFNQGTPLYDPAGPTYPPNGYTPFGFGTG